MNSFHITPTLPGTQTRLLTAHGVVIGDSREQWLSRIIYIITEAYARLLELEPTAGSFAEVVCVIDCGATGGRVWPCVNAAAQEALVFLTE